MSFKPSIGLSTVVTDHNGNVCLPLLIAVLLHGNGKIPAGPTNKSKSSSAGSSREIFGARLVSGYTIPGLSATRGLIAPVRDLLAPSLLLHRNDTTESQFSLPLCWVFVCPNSTPILLRLAALTGRWEGTPPLQLGDKIISGLAKTL
jgi:hypothetical protein